MSHCFNSFCYFSAREAVGAEETPYGGWLVTRLRSGAHGTGNVSGLSVVVGPKGGLGEHGDSVPRQLILTKVSLVERRPENYEVDNFMSEIFQVLSFSACMHYFLFTTRDTVFCDLLRSIKYCGITSALPREVWFFWKHAVLTYLFSCHTVQFAFSFFFIVFLLYCLFCMLVCFYGKL